MTTTEHLDLEFMTRALKLAKKGQFTTSPNPNVGCVIVKNAEILAEGWHQKAGTAHAEVHALASLSKQQTSGATAYVTLEPCSHYGRTPPCADALIEAGVARVVVAMLDPNPLVAGNGAKRLQEAGIETLVGVMSEQAQLLNRGFLKQMVHKKPFVQVKLASSLDGKTALRNGDSKWITGPDARADVQGHRALSCAVLSSAKSVLIDNAKLNVRKDDLRVSYPFSELVTEIRQPIKIILDGANRINATQAQTLDLFSDHSSSIILIKSKEAAASAKIDFEPFSQVKIVELDYTNGVFDLKAILKLCHEWQINSLWVEAGAQLSAAFVEQNFFDELIVYVAPKFLGKDASDMLPLGPFDSMENILQLSMVDHRVIGSDIKYTFSNQN